MRRKRFASLAAALLAVVCLAGSPLSAQAWAGRGRLQGTIKDESGKPVEGAKITLRQGSPVDPAKEGPAPLVTDKKGKWSVLGLAQGAWGVLIEKEGYQSSEGQVTVNEFAVAQPLNITLKVIPKEVIEAAQKKAEQESETGQAKAALERGNALLAEAQAAGSSPDKAKLAAARTAYAEGLAKLEAAKLDKPEQQTAVQQTRLSVLQTVAGIDYELGETDQAVAHLKEVLASKPDDQAVLQLLINILVGAGREAEAKQYMAKLPEGTKMDANTILNMGIKAFNENQMDKAFEAFDRAVKENPDRADAYYYRGLVYLNRGKSAEAKADFQKLLALDPNNKYADDAKAFLKDLH